MRSKRIFIFLSVILPICLALFIFLNQTKLPSILFNKTKVEYDENGLVKVKPKDKVENLIKDGNFQQGLSQEWKIYPLEKKDSITTKIIVKSKNQEDNTLTYVNDSSLKVETKEVGVGFEQKLDFKQKDIPHFLQANVLVISGEIKLAVLDKDDKEVTSVMAGIQEGISENLPAEKLKEYWQRLPIKVEDPKLAKKLLIFSTQPNTKYYITNIVLHPYQNYSERVQEISEYAARDRLKKCSTFEKEEYKKCVEDVIKLPPERWYEYGTPEFQSWNNENTLKETDKVLGNMTLYSVSHIFIANDYSEEIKDRFISYISSSWSDSGISKKLDISRAKVEIFDPTIPTSCKTKGYWTNTTVYLPQSFCNKDKIIFVLIRISGGDGFIGGKHVFIDSSGSWDEIKYIVKHEIGHMFGANDTDYVQINGNSLFTQGNNKFETSFDDIMFSGKQKVSSFTEKFINSKAGLGQDNPWNYQVSKLIFQFPDNNQSSEAKYHLHKGISGPSHGKGYISDSYTEGMIQNASLNLNENLFDQDNKEVASFWLVESGGQFYEGKLDLLDIVDCKLRGKSECNIRLEKREVSTVEILSPKSGTSFSNFAQIRARVSNSQNPQGNQWKLYALTDNIESLVAAGEGSLYEGQEFVKKTPPELENYKGNINLILKSSNSSGSYLEVKAEEKNVYFDNPNIPIPIINSVEIDLSGKIILKGGGFGQKGSNKTEVKIEEIDKTASSDKSTLWREDILEIPSGVLLGSGAIWSNYHFIVSRDGISSNKYLYSPQPKQPEQQPEKKGAESVYDLIQLINRPISAFYYAERETLTERMEYKCLKKADNIIAGLETKDNLLEGKHIYSESCNEGENQIENIRFSNQEADQVLNNGSQLYWFLCAVLPDSGNNFFNEQPAEIVDILNLNNNNGLYYACHLGTISLDNRAYSCVEKITIKGNNPRLLNLRYFKATFENVKTLSQIEQTFVPGSSSINIIENFWTELPCYFNQETTFKIKADLGYGEHIETYFKPRHIICSIDSCTPITIDLGELKSQKLFGQVSVLGVENLNIDFNQVRIVFEDKNNSGVYHRDDFFPVSNNLKDIQYRYSIEMNSGLYGAYLDFYKNEEFIQHLDFPTETHLSEGEVKEVNYLLNNRALTVNGEAIILAGKDKQSLDFNTNLCFRKCDDISVDSDNCYPLDPQYSSVTGYHVSDYKIDLFPGCYQVTLQTDDKSLLGNRRWETMIDNSITGTRLVFIFNIINRKITGKVILKDSILKERDFKKFKLILADDTQFTPYAIPEFIQIEENKSEYPYQFDSIKPGNYEVSLAINNTDNMPVSNPVLSEKLIITDDYDVQKDFVFGIDEKDSQFSGCKNDDESRSPEGTRRCVLGDLIIQECQRINIFSKFVYSWIPAGVCFAGNCQAGHCQGVENTCGSPNTCANSGSCPSNRNLGKKGCSGIDTTCCAPTIFVPYSTCNTNSCNYAGGVCTGNCPESQSLGEYGCLDSCGEPYCCELIPTPTTGSSFGGLLPSVQPTPLPTKVPTPTLTPVPTNTPTPVPQFSLCNNCEALGLGCPRPNECRVVNDAALCAKYNQNSTPCCLWDTENCRAGGYTPVCGAEVGKYPLNVIPDYCNKCHRSYQSDPWCPEQWDQTCGAGAPAYPRTKSPPNGFNVNLNQPDFSLSWYSFGEGFKRQCGEILPKEYRKWDTCNGTWKFDSRAQCIPYTDGQNSSDRDCWGYVCTKGSFGIPTEWRFYEVFIKKPEEETFTSICKITNIPNPPISKQDWIGTIPGEKKSCPFIPDKQGDYQWYVRAGYQLTTAGGGFTQHADSPVARFKVGELTLKAVCQYEANGETKINVSWDPAPNALKYALRFNNLANPEFINCSNNYSPAGDICLDNIRSNSYSKQVTPNQSYSWWIHQIDSGNIWGPPIYGKDFICQPPTATVVPQATNTSVPVPTTIIVPATAVPTITPVPTPYGQCISCKIFSAGPGNLWWEITHPLSIKKGQKVFLATRGELTNTQTQNLKARFRVNNTANNSWCTGEGLTLSPGDNSNQVWCETTLKHEDYFYVPYTFNQAGKQTIQSMLFNVETGWY